MSFLIELVFFESLRQLFPFPVDVIAGPLPKEPIEQRSQANGGRPEHTRQHPATQGEDHNPQIAGNK